VGLQVIAVDGKTARGARRGDGRAVHLFAALSQDTSVVLEQCALDPKTNEINTFGPLLDRLNITGAIITADALRTQRAHATYLTGRGVHYLTSFMTRSQHSRQVVTAARCPPAP